nr:hypothetical protein [Tanacetum cinerariifolium]
MGQDRQMQMVGGNGGNQFRQYAGQNERSLAGYNDVIGNQAKEKGCCLSSDIIIDCSEGRGRNPTSSRRNLATEVEKVTSVNRKLKKINADLTTELARFKNQERCFEISQEKYD